MTIHKNNFPTFLRKGKLDTVQFKDNQAYTENNMQYFQANSDVTNIDLGIKHMSIIIHFFFGLLLLGFSTTLVAKNWELGIEGIYTQFDNDPFFYAQEYEGLVDKPQRFSTKPKNNVNFQLFATYYLRDDMDISVAWTRARSSQNSSLSAETAIYEIPSVGYPGGAIRLLDEVFNDVSLKFDSVHLSLGRIKQWEHFSLRGSLGLEYARIDTNQQTTGRNTALPDVFPSAVSLTQNRVHGMGPRLGIDTNWHISDKVNVTTAAAFSWLLSDQNWQQSSSDLSGVKYHTNTSFNRWIPALSLRAGLEYSLISGMVDVLLTGGYQFQEYYNSLYTAELERVNFRQHGPYFGIHLRH